jgi:hypothetical protein
VCCKFEFMLMVYYRVACVVISITTCSCLHLVGLVVLLRLSLVNNYATGRQGGVHLSLQIIANSWG